MEGYDLNIAAQLHDRNDFNIILSKNLLLIAINPY